MAKNFRLSSSAMAAGLADNSACLATDRITVDGAHVGFMYRDGDGWNFFAGDESQDYVDDPDNLGVFALNDIANYDRAILPYLDAPTGSAWIRDGNQFVPDPEGAPVDPDEPAVILNPDFPVIDGRYVLAPEWAITLSEPMNRRFEDDALVIWRPGLTVFLTVWGNPNRDSPTIRLGQVKNMSAPNRFGEKDWSVGDLRYYTYRLDEHSSDKRVPALYGNVVGVAGHVQLAIYFDSENDLAQAISLVGGISSNSGS
jgi:hypothetical protein